MGENRAQFASWCGTTVRNQSFAYLKVKGWSEISEDKIRNMINRILKMSKTNAEDRSKYNMVSCTGRTSFSVIEQRLTEAANGVRPSRLEMFEKTRTHKNGSLVDAAAEEKMAQVKELQQQRYEEEISLDDEEIFLHIFGPNKRGHLLCEGMGPTQSTLRSIQAQQSKTMIEDTNCKVEEAMKRAENAEIRIDQIKKRAEIAELRFETTEKELHDMKEKFQEMDKELQDVKEKLSILMNLVAKPLEGQSN